MMKVIIEKIEDSLRYTSIKIPNIDLTHKTITYIVSL